MCEELRQALAERDAAEKIAKTLANCMATSDHDPSGGAYFIWWGAQAAGLVDGPEANEFVAPMLARMGYRDAPMQKPLELTL